MHWTRSERMVQNYVMGTQRERMQSIAKYTYMVNSTRTQLHGGSSVKSFERREDSVAYFLWEYFVSKILQFNSKEIFT